MALFGKSIDMVWIDELDQINAGLGIMNWERAIRFNESIIAKPVTQNVGFGKITSAVENTTITLDSLTETMAESNRSVNGLSSAMKRLAQSLIEETIHGDASEYAGNQFLKDIDWKTLGNATEIKRKRAEQEKQDDLHRKLEAAEELKQIKELPTYGMF